MATYRGRPATIIEYVMPTSVTASPANGLDGIEKPFHGPMIWTPSGRTLVETRESWNAMTSSAISVPSSTNMWRQRRTTIRTNSVPHRSARIVHRFVNPLMNAMTLVSHPVRNRAMNRSCAVSIRSTIPCSGLNRSTPIRTESM